MLRTALLVFAVFITVLVVLSLLPDRRAALPEQQIKLSDAQVTLFPQADPEAVWRFDAPRAEYDPEEGTSVLFDINEGRREVGGEVDFTVAAEKLTINREDDILGETIYAYLVESGDCLTMRGSSENPVVIDQQQGDFIVPVMEVTGPNWGDDTRIENMIVSFDLTDFDGGGPGTTTVAELRIGPADESRRETVCANS
ncbi:MAG TPA: hypothetical protein VF168_14580 [Trueperaceae bacterium]